MFQKARVKLTAWYLLIIFFIVLIFSGSIYSIQIKELERFVGKENSRFERQLVLRNADLPAPPYIDPSTVSEIKNRLLTNLLILDGALLLLSGVASYFLAGKTLCPIKEMIEDQDRFISDSSHELKTPLTSIKSALEVALMDKKLSLSDAKTLIKENIDDVNRLQKLSESLILLSRKGTKQKLNHENISAKEVISMALDQVGPLATKKRITLKPLAKEIIFSGDKEKINHLLVILLDNAIKYSPQDTKIIVKSWKSKHYVNFSVKDQGQGISEKDLPHIFDRFYRADTSRASSKIAGHGLGLSIAKMIVDQHGGRISVKSEVKNGTLFTVKLPQKSV
ncbi:MAG TPA: HAMP domain-containing sensor histidine kinase [Candidatus Woesebacteria bacterium]|nr:HAMP domain-containing sensor histidine kinase [Candidatus Woesebacteria bacterium]